ncbi:TPA: reactive chlorine resistance periplasmic protein RclB [Escherichia coli]
MFKKSVLFATLLSGVMAFSTNADDKIILKHISVSSVSASASASPTVLENAIADMARKYNASSWKVTSMRIDNNSTATAVLYK